MDEKAYAVFDSYDENAVIVFAETPGKAKAKAARSLWSDFIELSVRREPWADKYVKQGEVPPIPMLSNGWMLECQCNVLQDYETAVVKDGKVYCEKCVPKGEEENA